MAKCEQCGATIVLGARSFAEHTFCSTRCIGLAKQAGLRDESGGAPPQPLGIWTVPRLATAHALALPILLCGAKLLNLGTTAFQVVVALYWFWPLWLWPLVRHRSRNSLSYMVVLLLAFIVWAALVPTMFIITLMMTLSPGQAMHV